jgi:hypothetical protein
VEEAEKLQAEYRLTFLEGIGKNVLADILHTCHFGCTLSSEIQMIEYNVGITILWKCGILSGKTLERVVDALCSIPPDSEKIC